MTEPKRILAEILQRERSKRGWTFQQAADACELKIETYQGYEYGRAWPRTPGFVALSKGFGMSIPELQGGARPESVKKLEDAEQAVKILQRYVQDTKLLSGLARIPRPILERLSTLDDRQMAELAALLGVDEEAERDIKADPV